MNHRRVKGRHDTLTLPNQSLTLTHRLQIADFGMSRDMQLASRIETSTYGTVTHMPPELLTDGRLSRAADVYSFGVILNEMYCGALFHCTPGMMCVYCHDS